jgi:hypothetical protein
MKVRKKWVDKQMRIKKKSNIAWIRKGQELLQTFNNNSVVPQVVKCLCRNHEALS